MTPRKDQDFKVLRPSHEQDHSVLESRHDQDFEALRPSQDQDQRRPDRCESLTGWHTCVKIMELALLKLTSKMTTF